MSNSTLGSDQVRDVYKHVRYQVGEVYKYASRRSVQVRDVMPS